MERLLYKKVQHGNGAVWKKYMKRVEHEKSATWKNTNCHSEMRRCTRIVHYSAQMDNGPSVDGPLYISYLMLHYLMLYYFNVWLFDNNALVVMELVSVTLVIVAQFNVTVFWYCTIWC